MVWKEGVDDSVLLLWKGKRGLEREREGMRMVKLKPERYLDTYVPGFKRKGGLICLYRW